MIAEADIRAEALRLQAGFIGAGAVPLQTSILQPADLLLDLYGEDIRARAYVTSDPLRGEQMLRPDFTVPVVQMHMADGAEPARYTYFGEVFRRQEEDMARANEYFQVGYEIFDRQNPAAADAEVFAQIYTALQGFSLRAATGDIGILTAAVAGLRTTDARKHALLRHVWRPNRFKALLEQFSGRSPMPTGRSALLSANTALEIDAPMIGLRHRDAIEARIARLYAAAAVAPLSEAEVDLLDAILRVRDLVPKALASLRDIAIQMPALTPALDRLEARMAAVTARGIAVETLDFEASYGRTSMEYYDGFVFGFYAEGRPDLPPIASGGRYDALTLRLGQGCEIPAVGGVIRPDLTLDLRASV